MINFREVAYSNMKKNLLFRSTALNGISIEDQKYLSCACHIKLVVDVRSQKEIIDRPDVEIEGIRSINIPLAGHSDDESEKREKRRVVVKGVELPDMAHYYRQFVWPNRAEYWRKIFELLLTTEGGILFHCTEGKDRTGATYAIILSALGIDKEIIYKDYMLTNDFLPHPAGLVKALEGAPEDVKEAVLGHFRARKEYLDASFEEIDKIYGSLDKFLFECCALDELKLVKLKEKYLQ